jgi:hypothetical protein
MSALSIMCGSGNSECVTQAKAFYTNWIELDEAIPSDFKSIVYSTVIETGSSADWQTFYARTLATTNEAEKLRMLRALARSKDTNLLDL